MRKQSISVKYKICESRIYNLHTNVYETIPSSFVYKYISIKQFIYASKQNKIWFKVLIYRK